MSVKIKRIESELVKTISETLLLESNDEFLKTVTITAAEVASDLSYAKVYFTSLDNRDKTLVVKDMNEASDMIRKFIAQKMNLRQTPKLNFVYDDSVSYGNKIEHIIAEIHKKDQNYSKG